MQTNLIKKIQLKLAGKPHNRLFLSLQIIKLLKVFKLADNLMGWCLKIYEGTFCLKMADSNAISSITLLIEASLIFSTLKDAP